MDAEVWWNLLFKDLPCVLLGLTGRVQARQFLLEDLPYVLLGFTARKWKRRYGGKLLFEDLPMRFARLYWTYAGANMCVFRIFHAFS